MSRREISPCYLTAVSQIRQFGLQNCIDPQIFLRITIYLRHKFGIKSTRKMLMFCRPDLSLQLLSCSRKRISNHISSVMKVKLIFY